MAYEMEIGPLLAKRNIGFIGVGAKRVHPDRDQVELEDGRAVDRDLLVIATGPKLAFDEVEGLGPGGHTHSVCHVDHAVQAERAWWAFVQDPGHAVIGAVQGASCYGPAYEFAMIMDSDLRKPGIRDRVPMTFVTAEPYIGHLGLGGVGDCKGLLESAFRDRHIEWICNAKTTRVEAGKMYVTEHDEDGKPKKEHVLDFKYSMMLPAFKGVDAVCLADFGDTGAAFVALPQIPPRNVNWFSEGKWVHPAKVAFEKYFLRKMRKGTSEPVFEKMVMNALGIMKLEAK
jgi:sulfide:quinone oxidoreductase